MSFLHLCLLLGLLFLFFYIKYNLNLLALTILGALSSSFGRYLLFKSSAGVSEKVFSEYVIKNMKFLKNKIGKNKWKIFFVSFIWAITPVGSNTLFIAFGFSKIKIRYCLSGFFIGRLVSYFLLGYTTNLLFINLKEVFVPDEFDIRSVILNVLGLVILILYLAIDWEKLFIERKISFSSNILRLKK